MSRLLRVVVVAVTVGTAIAALGAAAVITTGRAALVVTHGVSMEPTYEHGDLVVVLRREAYQTGEVAAYERSGHVVLHRIIGRNADGLLLQGDNNASVDPVRPTDRQLIGRAALHLPSVGTWLERLTSPPALAAYTFLLLSGGASATRTRPRSRKERRTMSPRHRVRSSRALPALSPPLRRLAAVVAVVGVGAAAVAVASWTRPTSASSAGAGPDPTIQLSYTATVPASAAYDDTVVTAPQPVFRELTDAVDITYRYAGAPGSITITAELTTASGWRSSVVLAPEQALRAEQEGAVRLDLPSVQERAEAAAAVIGIPAGSVDIDVAPTISFQDGGEFTARLPLTLDALTLKPSSEQALAPQAATTASGGRDVPAEIGALGLEVDVATSRALSLVTLLATVLLGLLVAALGRRTTPAAERQRLQRRHKHLLLPVSPQVLTPGRPVVDVADPDHLVRVAERYGLLVLHWSRGGVDTYVVQDDAVTFLPPGRGGPGPRPRRHRPGRLRRAAGPGLT